MKQFVQYFSPNNHEILQHKLRCRLFLVLRVTWVKTIINIFHYRSIYLVRQITTARILIAPIFLLTCVLLKPISNSCLAYFRYATAVVCRRRDVPNREHNISHDDTSADSVGFVWWVQFLYASSEVYECASAANKHSLSSPTCLWPWADWLIKLVHVGRPAPSAVA